MDAETLLQTTVERLRKHRGRYAEIARQSPDLTYSWLAKMVQGQIPSPTVSSLQKLIDALDAYEGVQKPVPEPDPDAGRIAPPVESA